MKTTISAVILIAFLVGVYFFEQQLPYLVQQTKALGWVGAVLFVLLYCLATMFFLPTMVMTLAGGALYGPIQGTLLNLAGAALGAIVSFCISRYVAFDWFTSQIGPRTKRIIVGIEKRGWQFLALLRLLPIIPFNIVNYGMGLTRMKARQFILVTLIFLAPAEIVYTYCGYIGFNALQKKPFLSGQPIGWLIFLCCAIILIGVRLKFRQRPRT